MPEPRMPKPLPVPPAQAMHKLPFLIVGGLIIGNNPNDGNIPKKKSTKRCGICKAVGCAGLGGHKYCPTVKTAMMAHDGVNMRPLKKRKVRQCKLCLNFGVELW